MKNILYSHNSFEVYVDEKNYVTVLQKNEGCCVLPISRQGNILLIRIFRHGFKDYVWEVVKGFVETNEDPCGASQRELLEETNLNSTNIKLVSYMSQDAGVVKGRVALTIAYDIEETETKPQIEEQIVECKWVSKSEFEKMILNNEIQDIFTQLLYYKAKELNYI